MAQEGLRVGQLVRSKAGRDAGRYFLVVGVKSPTFVAVSDGRFRPIARPKLKNVRHLEIYKATLREAPVRFEASRVVTDQFVIGAIRELLAELGLTEPPAAAGWGAGKPGAVGGGEEPEEDVRGYGQEGRDRD